MKPDAEAQEEGLGLGDTGCVTHFNKDGSSSRKMSARDISTLPLPDFGCWFHVSVWRRRLCGGSVTGTRRHPSSPATSSSPRAPLGLHRLFRCAPPPHSPLQGSWRRAVAGRTRPSDSSYFHALPTPTQRWPGAEGRVCSCRWGTCLWSATSSCSGRSPERDSGPRGAAKGPHASSAASPPRSPSFAGDLGAQVGPCQGRLWPSVVPGSLPRRGGPPTPAARFVSGSSRAPGGRAEPLRGRLEMQEKPGTGAQEAAHFPSV